MYNNFISKLSMILLSSVGDKRNKKYEGLFIKARHAKQIPRKKSRYPCLINNNPKTKTMQKHEPHTENIAVFTAEDLYDLSMLEEMGDNEYLVQVLNIFLRDTPVELKEMKVALNTYNIEIIAQKAHKIKGSAGVIQALELCCLLAGIEKIAKAGIINDTLKGLVENTQQLYNITEQALKKHIQELK